MRPRDQPTQPRKKINALVGMKIYTCEYQSITFYPGIKAFQRRGKSFPLCHQSLPGVHSQKEQSSGNALWYHWRDNWKIKRWRYEIKYSMKCSTNVIAAIKVFEENLGQNISNRSGLSGTTLKFTLIAESPERGNAHELQAADAVAQATKGAIRNLAFCLIKLVVSPKSLPLWHC